MTLYAQELPHAPPGAGPEVQLVWYVVVFILLIVAGLIFLLTKRKVRVEDIGEKRASGLEGLLKIRDEELVRAKGERDKFEEDFRDIDTELKVVTGVKMQELAQFWAEKDRIEGRIAALESENRALRKALSRWEAGEMGAIHTTNPPAGRPND